MYTSMFGSFFGNLHFVTAASFVCPINFALLKHILEVTVFL